MAWAEKSGWKANPARAANSRSSSPSNLPRILQVKERIDERHRQDFTGGRRTRDAALHSNAARSGGLQRRNRLDRRRSIAKSRERHGAGSGIARCADAGNRWTRNARATPPETAWSKSRNALLCER